MKISHLGIKLSVAVLVGMIMISYLVYWKSISALSDHMASLIVASNHMTSGELFHSAVHSMMMDAGDNSKNKARYDNDRKTADNSFLKLQSYIALMPDSIEKKMLSENTVRMSKAYTAFLDYTDKIMLGKKIDNRMHRKQQVQRLFDYIFKEYKTLHQHHSQQRKDLMSKTQSIQKSIRLMLAIQVSLAFIVSIMVILYLDRVVLKLFDLTEKLALHDKLTGLYNRHSLDRIVSDLDRPGGIGQKGYGIILLDIDHFKRFNDAYGHPAGDQLLMKLSKVLLKNVRSQDKVVRFGGEEILILLSWVDISGTERVARKICRAVAENPFELSDGAAPKKVTVSIGYAATSHDQGSFQDLLEIADKRLYYAKDSGRNRVAGP